MKTEQKGMTATNYCLSKCSIQQLFEWEIAHLRESRRFSTANNYKRTLNSINHYLGRSSLPIAKFNAELVSGYNSYLIGRGIKRNSISFYMRVLRAMYRKAVRSNIIKQPLRQGDPFADVYTGVDRTHKRAISEEELLRISRCDFTASPRLAFTRDLFIFSYCARGMAFVDMAYLRWHNIRQGVLAYTRRKTGQPMSLSLERQMMVIIQRWSVLSIKDYIFPILTSDEPEVAHKQYQTALRSYNSLLKCVSRAAGVKHFLTSYTSRHSWATTARNHGIPIDIISAALGHTTEKTTRIYIASIDNSVIDNANQRLINAVLHTVSSQETEAR